MWADGSDADFPMEEKERIEEKNPTLNALSNSLNRSLKANS